VHALMSMVLKYRSVVGLGDFAMDLTALATKLRALIKLLADPERTAFVIVTRPAMLPRLETERLARELQKLDVPIGAIVANAVNAPTCSRCAEAARLEAPHLERLGRLARRVAQAPRLLAAPAIHPGPRGAGALARWRATWSPA
jgi:arsenite/tail-anchored protein-transporting ATPase